MNIVDTLKQAIEDNASDIFIVAGANISFKKAGVMYPVSCTPVTPGETRDLVEQIYQLSNGIQRRYFQYRRWNMICFWIWQFKTYNT